MEYLNLRIKFQKLTERFSSSLEKIEMLEQNNTVLKEENHKLSKTLLYDNKLKGGYYQNKLINLINIINYFLFINN